MRKGQTSPPWSGEELRFLRENYTEHTAAWICRRLGRSQGAVIKQARRQGLSKKRGRPLKGSVYVKFKRNRKTKGGDK
ncbi:MAG: hypothetical protein J6T33_09755 [Bacteroidales bacterium]|nr:hypothetical protein [Bacteroidales bacterium]